MADLTNAFIRITIGNPKKPSDVFLWGVGSISNNEKLMQGKVVPQLIEVSYTIAEGEEQNSLKFTVTDPDKKLFNKYFNIVKEMDGLNPIVREKTNDSSSNENSPAGSNSNTATGNLEPEIKALLDTIGWAEGANYNTLFGGGTFSSYAQHPNRAITRGGVTSTAAGRYQFLSSTWEEVKRQIGATSFEPGWQDKGAINRLKIRNAYQDALGLNYNSVLDKISWEWASIPASNGNFRYPGQGSKTPTDIINYWKAQLEKYKNEDKTANTESISTARDNKKTLSKEIAETGQQVTLEVGTNGKPLVINAYIHTGLQHTRYPVSTLTFDCSSATANMNRVISNSAFSNVTFKKLASELAAKYGLKLEMEEEGARYEYISQRSQSDWQFIVTEAARQGMTVTKKDDRIIITPRQQPDKEIKLNLDELISFQVQHTAGTGDKGAREPKASNESGRKSFRINPSTGRLEAMNTPLSLSKKEDSSVSGSHTSEKEPILSRKSQPGKNESKNNLNKEQRVKGIKCTIEKTVSTELLEADINTALYINSENEQFMQRYWVIDGITHTFNSNGFITKIEAYTPLKNKSPEPEPSSNSNNASENNASRSPDSNPGGYIAPQRGYVVTSGFRTAHRPNHFGVDTSSGKGSPVYAMADGTVVDVNNSCVEGDRRCGGRYGRRVFINHPNGDQTRYAHLSSVNVSVGDKVKQGDVIGTEGNTGDSSGSHLHSELRKGGTPVDWTRYI